MSKQQFLRPLILKIQEGTLDWDNKLIIVYTRNQMAKWKIQRRIPKDHHRQFEMRRCLYACWCSTNMEQLSIMHGQGFSQELFQEWFTFPPQKSQLDPYFRARSKESLGWGVGLAITRTRESRTAKTALVWKHWRGIRALEKTDDERNHKRPRWKKHRIFHRLIGRFKKLIL